MKPLGEGVLLSQRQTAQISAASQEERERLLIEIAAKIRKQSNNRQIKRGTPRDWYR
jgi:hypothetical protein